ncbi:MAG: hydrolase [Oceanococcus sp.]
MKHGQIVRADFRPHPLLRNAHLQTMLPALWRPLPELPLEKERWELPDGDFVDLAWFAKPQTGQPIAVLVHGLTGGFDSKYLRGTALKLKNLGWAGVILQLRGSGSEPNRMARAYHQGDTGDLHALLQRLKEENPGSYLAAAGWSLGANIVLKAAGEDADKFAADSVVAASVPFQLQPCAERMRQGVSRLYQRRLMGDLKLTAAAKAAACELPSPVNVRATQAARDFFEFDDAWTAPLNGFENALDYYSRCECGQFLSEIQVPGLIVHSQDDPFMRADIVPTEQQLSPSLRLELAQRGGHVGFVSSNARGGLEFWLEQRMAQWLQQQRIAS